MFFVPPRSTLTHMDGAARVEDAIRDAIRFFEAQRRG